MGISKKFGKRNTPTLAKKYGNFPSNIDVCNITPTVTIDVIDKSAEVGECHQFPKKLRKNIINQNDSYL
jgi:hypothetical protein